MPNFPKNLTNTNVSADVLNALRNDASTNYRDYVPYVSGNSDSLRGIGTIIMDNPALMNEFIGTLVNRIAFAIIESKAYTNRLSFLKKGIIATGETIEDIFTNIARPYQYDGNAGGDKVFGKYKADVRTAFYVTNMLAMYPITVNRMMLKNAFNSYDGLDMFIESVIQSTYTAMEYDEQNIMLYLIAKQIHDGRLHMIQSDVPTTKETAENMLVSVRALASNFTMLTPKSKTYNIAGVMNYVRPEDLIVLLTPEVRASVDVRGLAAAFNISYADFENKTVTVPSLADIDVERLNILFADDDTYTEFSQTELEALSKVCIVAMDEKFIQCYDNVIEMRDMPNPASLDWNYFLHHWATYAVSPFANCAVIGDFSNVYTTFAPASMRAVIDGLSGYVSKTSGNRTNIEAIEKVGATVRITPVYDSVNATDIAALNLKFGVVDDADIELDEQGNLTFKKDADSTNTNKDITLFYTDPSDGSRKSIVFYVIV